MLSCKQVAQLADHILEQDANASLKWQMRLHLLVCANCRRFVRHLKLTQNLVPQAIYNLPLELDDQEAEDILAKVKVRAKRSSY